MAKQPSQKSSSSRNETVDKLAKAEAIIEVQGKVQALLEELSKSADTEEPSTPSSTTE